MKSSNDGIDGRPIWAINGRFMTQRMTGVQRYAYEIVASLDDISSEDGDVARGRVPRGGVAGAGWSP